MTVQFANTVNITAQPGDIVYFTDDPEGEVIYPIGPIASITTQGQASVNNTLNITTTPSSNRPTTSSYFLFAKDNEANSSSLLGYYMDIELRNDSPKYAEVFSSGTEFFESTSVFL